MPPLRTDRASKACTTCRRQKTRCYRSESGPGTCLRCQTLKQPCSLELQDEDAVTIQGPAFGHDTAHDPAIYQRLDRLELALGKLVERIDTRLDIVAPISKPILMDGSLSSLSRAADEERSSEEPDEPPVMVIRDAATEIGIHSPNDTYASPANQSHILSKGFLSYEEACQLLSIFQQHYGRWVKFDESMPIHDLLSLTARSPLLLCSACLIAVRHTTDDLAARLAPPLFDEAQTLVSRSLLTTNNSTSFFESVLVLSLWSTTVGQVPLSIDGWLLTSYAIQQALANPNFAFLTEQTSMPVGRDVLDTWCVWNHLCLAHLQYCIGTRRKAVLHQNDIEACKRLIDRVDQHRLSNFETRMVAEVKLYWIIYNHSTDSPIDVGAADVALRSWRTEWEFLFKQPRSQFLQMGFDFAQLLTLRRAVKANHSRMGNSRLAKLIQLTTSIINLAMETADERTQHLTDHIYHIVIFSAITLCQLLRKYEDQLQHTQDVPALDSLVTRLVVWLRSIGLRCHVARMLGDLLSAQHRRLRPDGSTPSGNSVLVGVPTTNAMFPHIVTTEMLNGVDTNLLLDLWPPWD
ncbi:hypothetical protein B0J18DRAFT_427082 [Chaetomium sp. MPI-SDFR-AT-0129]|nr:hypothetical protein B0J18DRAFT_427082 [Chaetomium sp. MPI-SDFR-AT-0129]